MLSNKFIDCYYETLFNSLLFSLNIEHDLNIYFRTYKKDDYFNIINYFCSYLDKKSDDMVMDYKIKNNIYKLMDFITNVFKNETYDDKVEINKAVNFVKKFLNRDFYYNISDYLKNQILIRDCGINKNSLNPFLIKSKHISNEAVEMFRDEYCESISKDIVLLFYLLDDEKEFYTNDSNFLLLDKNFYRTLNYFILTQKDLLLENDYINRIGFVINRNLELFNNLDDDYDDSDANEIFNLHNVSVKLLKKTYKHDLKG